MAISHLCPACGTELARIRVEFDPLYHLPIVRCPACDQYQIRRAHPMRRGWHQCCRIGCGLYHLAWRIVLVVWIGLMMYWINRGLLDDLAALARAINNPDAGRVYDATVFDLAVEYAGPFVFWIVSSLIGGAVVAGTFAHWKRPFAWGAWMLFLLILVSDSLIAETCNRAIDSITSVSHVSRLSSLFEQWYRDVAATALTFGLSLAGAPLGWLFLKASRTGRQRRWRKRRARFRKRKRGE